MKKIVRISIAIDPWLYLILDDLVGRWLTGYLWECMPAKPRFHVDDLHTGASEVIVTQYKPKISTHI